MICQERMGEKLMKRSKNFISLLMILVIILRGTLHVEAHTSDYLSGTYTSTAQCNQSNLKLRIDPSAQNSFLTSSVYNSGYAWNDISSGVKISNILIATSGTPYISGYYYVYGATYSDGTLGEVLAYNNGNVVGASDNWGSIAIQMNTNSNAFSSSNVSISTAASKTFIHEVGHALKLGHPEIAPSYTGHIYNGHPVAIMNQGIPNGVEIATSVQQHDKDNLKAKWGN